MKSLSRVQNCTLDEIVNRRAIPDGALLGPRLSGLSHLYGSSPFKARRTRELVSFSEVPLRSAGMKEPRKSPPSKPQSKSEEKLDEELEESFPASDPPASTPTSAGGPDRSQTKHPKPDKPPRHR